MAFIDDQPFPVETQGENCHEIEFNFTVNNYHDIETVGFTKDYKINCRMLETEWSVWIIFLKKDSIISCVVHTKRTDFNENPVNVSLNLVVYHPSKHEFREISNLPETEVRREWIFKQTVNPVVPPENKDLLDGDNLSVKFCLKVAGCH
ncbi:hypothetical protein HNY73_003271 [Argiope bruennichi]|uniref:Uncharacterized protein n=1 Tax=Argiope bruennichi TaxID=94029 RepID=A0A8T0FWG0_ARGBR|nr:hypothetical protein HNY73_003271 [Argiope bruennichi]